MSTRALTVFVDSEHNEIAAMKRHYDGYPSCHGKELKDFVAPIKLTNGIGRDSTNTANGMDCLAAQVVAHFKAQTGKITPGKIYLCSPPSVSGIKDADFLYFLSDVDGEIFLEVYDVYKGKTVYGPIANYIPTD